MNVIRESYRAGESWPFFVTLERGEEIRGYFRVDRDALLALADEMKRDTCRVDELQLGIYGACYLSGMARRIREALGVEDA